MVSLVAIGGFLLPTKASAFDEEQKRNIRKLAVIDMLDDNFADTINTAARSHGLDMTWQGTSVSQTSGNVQEIGNIVADVYADLAVVDGISPVIERVYEAKIDEYEATGSTLVPQLKSFVDNGTPIDMSKIDQDEHTAMLRRAGFTRMIDRTVGRSGTTTTSTPASTSSPHVGNNGVGQQADIRAAE